MTKQLSLFLLTISMLSSVASNAQTKDETIGWLRENLEKYIAVKSEYITNAKLANINECEVTLTYHFKSGIVEDDVTLTLPTNINQLVSGQFRYINKDARYVWHSGRTFYDNNSSSFVIDNREANIAQRIANALKYLNSFCPKKDIF